MRRILFSLCFMLPLLASAQRLKVNAGDYEVSGSGVFNSAQLGADVRLGTFIDNYLQAGGQFGWHDSDFATRTKFGAYGLYLYETRTYLLPFVGAGLGFGSLDLDGGSSKSGIELDFFFGLKYFLADNVSLNTEVNLGLSTDKTYLRDDKAESSDVSIRVGISYLW
jgi:opacity protein-like surface antigen